jgi:hypothetical protein
MTELFISLSTNGLRNIQRMLYPNDFVFIIGDQKVSCPSFIAEFLSPRISLFRSADPTVQEFVVDVSDGAMIFSEFVCLAEGSPFQVTESNFRLLGSICCKLGNTELLNSIFDTFEGELNISNIADRLRMLSEADGHYEEELNFAASHFHEITKQSESESESESESKISMILFFVKSFHVIH